MPPTPNIKTKISSPTSSSPNLDSKSASVSEQKLKETSNSTKKITEQTSSEEQQTKSETEIKKETKEIEEKKEEPEEVKKIPTEEEEEEDSEDTGPEDRSLEKSVGTGMQISFFIVCIVIAIVKDILELILALTGVGNLVSFVVSLPFSVLLAFLLIASGRKSNYDSMSGMVQSLLRGLPVLIDGIPIISALPTSIICVIWAFFAKKNSKQIKNAEQKTKRIQGLAEDTGKIKEKVAKAKNSFSKILSKL